MVCVVRGEGVDMLCVPCVPSHQSTLQQVAVITVAVCTKSVLSCLHHLHPQRGAAFINQHLPCSDAGILNTQRHFYCGEQWSGAGHTVTRITQPVLVLVTRLAAWLTTSAPEGDELYLQPRSCGAQTQTRHNTCCK